MSVLTQLVCLPVESDRSPGGEESGVRRMSAPRLSGAAQLRYMLQWFEEWSELQRQDFLPLLAAKLASPALYLNGVVGSMAAVNCQNKPMTLFQCRIKLFNEWYPTWSEEERGRLVKGVSEADREFGAKLQAELSTASEPALNGAADDHPAGDAAADTSEAAGDPQGAPEAEDTGRSAPAPDSAQDGEEEAVQELPENTMPLEIAATS